jgi:hypothetical protein
MFLWINKASSLIFEGSLNHRIVKGTCNSRLLLFFFSFFLAGDSPSILYRI